MPFPGAAPIAASIAGPLISKLMGGGPSASERLSEKLTGQAAEASVEEQLNRAEIRDQIKDLARAPSAKRGILSATGGQGFQLGKEVGEDSNASKLFPAINFNNERTSAALNKLLGGLSSGTGAVNNLTADSAARRAAREDQQGDVGMGLGDLLGGLKFFGGPGGG